MGGGGGVACDEGSETADRSWDSMLALRTVIFKRGSGEKRPKSRGNELEAQNTQRLATGFASHLVAIKLKRLSQAAHMDMRTGVCAESSRFRDKCCDEEGGPQGVVVIWRGKQPNQWAARRCRSYSRFGEGRGISGCQVKRMP